MECLFIFCFDVRNMVYIEIYRVLFLRKYIVFGYDVICCLWLELVLVVGIVLRWKWMWVWVLVYCLVVMIWIFGVMLWLGFECRDKWIIWIWVYCWWVLVRLESWGIFVSWVCCMWIVVGIGVVLLIFVMMDFILKMVICLWILSRWFLVFCDWLMDDIFSCFLGDSFYYVCVVFFVLCWVVLFGVL